MINHNRLQLTKLAFALSMALAISTPVLAQNTTSAIGGRISNASGAPVAGAQVTIVHMESGSVSKVVADAQGRYSARGLRVGGPYTVTITKDGVAEKFENVFLQLAETANVDATLGAPAIQTVTIAGRAAGGKFNSSSMGAGTTIGSKELAALGSVQRSLSDYARLDPRLSQTDKERGEISAGGQNARFNSITIDGVSISDTFGLEGNGLPTNKQPISIDSIQSVQVNISNYDVTQKGYTGANINAVTKSGTNTWKGSVYHVYRDDRLTGDRYNPADRTYSDPAEFKEKTTGFTLGGPLIKDKLFMFVSGEDFASTRTAPAFGPLGSAANNVGITQNTLAEIQRVARDVYGFDAGSPNVPDGLEQTVADRLIKLDWNVNDDHRVNLRWQKTVQKEPIISGYSNSGVGLSSQNYNETKKIESTVLQWFGDWTPTFSTEAKISRRDSGKSYVNSANLPAMSLQISGPLAAEAPAGTRTGNRFVNFGTERSRHFNELDTKTIDMYGGATWVLGDHEVKGGADYAKNSMFNAFLQNTKGNYTFGCINSSATVTYTTVTGAVNCQTSPAATIEKAAIENFTRGRLISYLLQTPVAGVSLNDTAAVWELANTGLFLQDTWTVSPRLKVNFGVRYDQYSTDDRPRKNAKVATDKVAGAYNANPTLIVRETGGFGLDNTQTIDGDSLVQPRFGFNYNFASARPTQLRGGVGLFGGAALNVWLGNPFANPGVSTTTVGCGTSGFAACTGTGLFSPDVNNQRAPAGATPAANVDILSKGLAQPSVWKANLGGEHELPWFGLVVGVEYLHTKVNKGLYFQSLNIGGKTRTGPDGRELFWTEPGYTAGCANGTGGFNSTNTVGGAQCSGFRAKALSNASFNDVIKVTETKKGGGNLVSLSLSNARKNALRWDLSYTYTDATEVSNLSSSTSGSNFGARSIFNPNEDIAANSSYLVKDRVSASMTWEKRFFGSNYKTSFGAYYEGRSGKPYSWTFNNDMNGDGTASNDLMYIPTAFGSGEVIFRGAAFDTATNKAAETSFWNTVNSNKALRDAAGGVTERQASFAPWTNSIDLRLTQEIPGLFKGNKGVFVVDFQNFGNLLNKKWGRINEVAFASAGGNARSFVDYAGMQDGKYVYQVRDAVEDYVLKSGRSESQWAIQVTARYEF